MRFNKSGKQILITTDKGLVLMVDGYDGRLTHAFLSKGADDSPGTEPAAACFTSDDNFLLIGNENGTIDCYDSTTGELRRKLEGHVGRVGCIEFNPKYQQFASSCTNTALWLW
jgi:WD40 repeat protein